MKTVWKYELKLLDEQIVTLPYKSRCVHVGADPKGRLCLWAEVETDNPLVEYGVRVEGTGHPLSEGFIHVGSAVIGNFVWHVYLEN
jgi:hypothetical protein